MLKFKKNTYITIGKKEERDTSAPSVPEGLWIKCPKCGEMLYKEDVVSNHYVCYKCSSYFRVKAKNRIRMIADRHTFQEWDSELPVSNPLNFPDYEEKLAGLKEKTRLSEAVVTGQAKIDGKDVALGICDTRFLMGSMGHVVGEKITRAFERATKLRLPIILFTCSGGARMQEGIVSLMQMAKTSAAVKRHSEAGLLYITVLTDPTTGGVTASFAMLGDIILAEPGALIGFAGPRVIEQTIGQKLPEGFQRAEFLVEKGFVDRIVERPELKNTLSSLLAFHQEGGDYSSMKLLPDPEAVKARRLSSGKRKKQMSAWERVETARSSDRLTSLQYMENVFEDFMELHGDRLFGDDGAVVGGIARLGKMPVTVIGQQKGRSLKENKYRNFGMPNPEGYRKALRLMKQAEKFGRPVINFVDTPGAFCGLEAEERGQGEAIARNLLEMSALKVPVLTIVIGEGGSGGALAMAVGNEVWMMENATYSVLSPEGFASILWKDSKRAKEAAEVMKITAADLKSLGIIEQIIREETPACEKNLPEITEEMREKLIRFVKRCSGKTGEELAALRYDRFRKM